MQSFILKNLFQGVILAVLTLHMSDSVAQEPQSVPKSAKKLTLYSPECRKNPKIEHDTSYVTEPLPKLTQPLSQAQCYAHCQQVYKNPKHLFKPWNYYAPGKLQVVKCTVLADNNTQNHTISCIADYTYKVADYINAPGCPASPPAQIIKW